MLKYGGLYENIIYLSTMSNNWSVVCCNGSNQIDISDFQDYQLPEGTMLLMVQSWMKMFSKDVLRIINKKELVIVLVG